MIYRYIGFEQNCDSKLETIFNNDLWFSSPRKFNDPFDCDFPVAHEFTLESLRTFTDKCSDLTGLDVPQAISDLQTSTKKDRFQCPAGVIDHFRSQIATYGICCFAKHWDSILMWSHYADKHKGICIGYDDSRNNDYLCEVKYSTHYPDIHISDAILDRQKMLEIYLLTKATNWLYEQEYRLILPDMCDANDPSPFPITEITFGLKTNFELKTKIISDLNEGIDFFDAIHEQTGKYGLSRKESTI